MTEATAGDIRFCSVPTLTEASRIAGQASQGLLMVALGEDQVIAGWLLYGKALNDGRKLYGGDDKQFGKWVLLHQLGGVHDLDRAAAMWAAASEPDFLVVLRRANPKVRTLRGLHAKWKVDTSPAPRAIFEVPTQDELRVVQKLRAIADHASTDPRVRQNVQRKLDTYAARFGEVEPETPTQQLTKMELSAAITKAALLKARKNPKVFDIIDYAIRHTYGASEGQLDSVLKTLSEC